MELDVMSGKRQLGIAARIRIAIAALGVLSLSAFAVQNAAFSPGTITLGNDIALSFDFEQSYQIADCRIYVDLNHSGTIDSGDPLILREKFWDNDGWDENPALHHYQRILVPDEIHQIPAQYVALVEDGGTPGLATFTIIPISSSTSISGTVVQPGNTENLVALLGMMQASGPPRHIYTCLTNSSGQFTVSIPDSLSGRFGFFWVFDIADVEPDWAVSNLEFTQVEGNITGHNVQLHPVDAWVYGQLRDETGLLLSDGYTIDGSTDAPSDMGAYQRGWYHLGTTSGAWYVGGEDEQLRYDYMSAHQSTSLTAGDSVRMDLVFYRANGTITGTVYLDGSPGTRIQVGGLCSLGCSYAYSDMNGQYALHISNIATDYEVEIRQIPSGYYVLEQHTGIPASATNIDFHLVPIPGGVSGILSVQPGDPIPNYSEFTAWAEQEGGGESYAAVVAPDGSYEIGAPEGLYTLRLGQPYPPPMNEVTYLWNPQEYDSVEVGNTIAPGYNFELNHANARVMGQLTGLPDPEASGLMMYAWEGTSQSVYYNAVFVASDFRYEMRICEGTWHLVPPQVEGYNVSPSGYTIVVTENDSLFSGFDFDYASSWVSPEPVDLLASEFQIGACFPNPFNSTVVMTYKVPESGVVTLTACNVLGQRVAEVYEQMVSAGVHQIGWKPEDIAAGIYFLELTWKGHVQIAKVMYLR